jgi:hypothetical protein
MFFGAFYWAAWRIILPKLGNYKLIPGKETLNDGTVVTIVRTHLRVFSAPLMLCYSSLMKNWTSASSHSVTQYLFCNFMASGYHLGLLCNGY